MGVVKIQAGNKVKIKGTDTTGTVLTTYPEKSGTRGRPKTYAQIVLGDGSEATYGVPELTLI